MKLLSILETLEENDNLHQARVIILLGAFGGRDGTGTVDGLTKLAKLDFLLRYPVYLERALQARGTSPSKIKVADHERKSVESSMVRFRYGPWDFRYRRFINLLVARGLAKLRIEGRKIRIGLTPKGVDVAGRLSAQESFRDWVNRAPLLKRHFNLGPTSLMKFVYDTFPEIATLRLGEEIR